MILYEYEKYLSINYSKSTKDSYFYAVKKYFEYMGNHIKVLNAERKDIYNYIAYLDNLKGTTRRTYIKSLKNFYNFLNRNLSDYLFEGIKVYNFDIKYPRYLFSCQCKALLQYYPEGRNRNYTQVDKQKMNLIYATYESLNSQFVEYRVARDTETITKKECKKNVI